VTLAAVLAVAAPASALPIGIADLWNGATVTANSPLIEWTTSSASNMFGGSFGVEPANTLFADRLSTGAGTIHWVEWQTTTPQTIRSFELFAHHDGYPRDATYRGFDLFRLYAYNSGTNAFDILLYNLQLSFGTPPYYDPTGALNPCLCVLDVLADVQSVVTTSRWRAEFRQYGAPSGDNDGPRIMELNGFDTSLQPAPVPEPATIALVLTGLAGARVRRFKRRAR
jgi:hypothetical protein